MVTNAIRYFKIDSSLSIYILLAQFDLYVHKGDLEPLSFYLLISNFAFLTSLKGKGNK